MAGAPNWNRVQGFLATAQWAAGPFASTSTGALSRVEIGDLLILSTQADTSGGTTAADTVTDTLANVYTRISAESGGVQVDVTNTVTKNAWWCIVTVAGTPTITYNCSPSKGFLSIIGDHFSGSNSQSTPVVASGNAQVNPGNGNDVILAASRRTAVDGCLLWATSGDGGTPTATIAPGGGWSQASAPNATIGDFTEFQIQTMRGPWQVVATDATNGSTHTYLTIAAAISPVPLPGSPPNVPPVANSGPFDDA